MAIGKVGNFATTEAPRDPLLGTLQNIEQVGFQKRAEDRAIAEAKAKAKKEEDDALAVDLAKIKSETTKFPTKNALIIDAMDKLRNGVTQKAKERASGKISSTDYNIYKNNAESQISLIDQAAKRINAQSTDYAKQLAEGKFAKGFEENALNFGGAYDKNNIFLELNPDGTFTSYLYDDTDPENPKILDKNGLAEFGQNAFVPVYNYDLDKDKQEFITAYPKVLNERFVGDTKVGTKGIAPEIQKAIDLKVEATIANKDALAIKAREITGKANPKVEDPEIIEQVRQNLQKEYKGLYATDKMVDEATSRGNLGIARKKAEKEEIQKTIAKFSDKKDEATGKVFTTRNKNIISFPEKAIPFKNLGGSKSGLNSGYISSFALQNDGDVVVIGKALVDKGQKFKVGGKDVNLGQLLIVAEDNTNPQLQEEAKAVLDSYNVAANYQNFVRIPSGDELGLLAAQAGYNNVNELQGELKELNKKTISNKNKGSYDDL